MENKKKKGLGKMTKEKARQFLQYAEDGVTLQTSQGSTCQPTNSLSPTDNAAGLNAAGPMPVQGGYQAAQGPVYDQTGINNDPTVMNNNSTAPSNKKGKGKFAKFLGKTFDGAKSTDTIAGIVQAANAVIPYTPINNNQNQLIEAYNPYPLGTGSHAIMKNGGKIMYEGGYVDAMQNGGLVVEDNKIEPISDKTGMIQGKLHSEGGTKLAYQGKQVEAEKGEPISIDPRNQAAVVWGNLHIPGTSTKFKKAAEMIGDKEKDIAKMKDEATHFVNTSDPKDKFYATRFNTGKVLQDAVSQNESAVNETKNYLTDVQNHMLTQANKMGIEPKELSKVYKKAKYGLTIKAEDGYSWDGIKPIEDTTPIQKPVPQVGNYTITPSEEDPMNPSIMPVGDTTSTYNPSNTGVIGNEDTPTWRKGMSDEQATQNLSNPGYTPTKQMKPQYKGLRNKLGIPDVLPELSTIFEKAEPVASQQFNPTLKTPYQVSFDDRVNANQGDFNAIEKTLAKNPAALGALSAQKYGINNQIKGEEFRTNQGISNDVTNGNTAILNQAKEINLKLSDEQMVRSTQAKANTADNRFRAAESLSSKIGQNKRANSELAMLEASNHYVFDPKTGKYNYIGPDLELAPQKVGIQNPYPARTKEKTYIRDNDGNVIKEDDTMFGGGMVGSTGVLAYRGMGTSKKTNKKKKYFSK